MANAGSTSLTVTSCPDCGVPAEIAVRFSLPSTHGPVDHIVVHCAAGHHFRMPADMLPAAQQEQLAAPAARWMPAGRPARATAARVPARDAHGRDGPPRERS